MASILTTKFLAGIAGVTCIGGITAGCYYSFRTSDNKELQNKGQINTQSSNQREGTVESETIPKVTQPSPKPDTVSQVSQALSDGGAPSGAGENSLGRTDSTSSTGTGGVASGTPGPQG